MKKRDQHQLPGRRSKPSKDRTKRVATQLRKTTEQQVSLSPKMSFEEEDQAEAEVVTAKNVFRGKPPSERQMILRQRTLQAEDQNVHGGEPQQHIKMKISAANRKMYFKKNYCLYCERPYSRITRHLKLRHSGEVEVAEALAHKQGSTMHNLILSKIRNMGNYHHNSSVLSSGKGYIVPKKQTISPSPETVYLPCKFCYGMFVKRNLTRHQKACQLQGPAKKKRKVQEGRSLLPMDTAISNGLENILGNMTDDSVYQVVQSDTLILSLGERMFVGKGEGGRLRADLRNQMRQLARLVLAARKIDKDIVSLKDLINPGKLSTVLEAVKKMTGFDHSTNTLPVPSKALRLRHSLVKMSYILQGEALRQDDNALKERAEQFMKRIETEWTSHVSSDALKALHPKKGNSPQVLPLSEDLEDHLNGDSKFSDSGEEAVQSGQKDATPSQEEEFSDVDAEAVQFGQNATPSQEAEEEFSDSRAEDVKSVQNTFANQDVKEELSDVDAAAVQSGQNATPSQEAGEEFSDSREEDVKSVQNTFTNQEVKEELSDVDAAAVQSGQNATPSQEAEEEFSDLRVEDVKSVQNTSTSEEESTMPRLQSGVWKHFTPAIKDGRETFLCNYCSKTNSKNATKMQMHLDKCKEYSVFSQQSPGPDGSSSASIPVPSSSFLPTSSPGGQFLIDSVDQGSQAFADECLARAVYATGSPLTLTENAYWRRFLGVLRPAYCPPTWRALGGHLLDSEHDRMRAQVRCAIAKADCVTVLCGGWAGAGAVDYMVAAPLPLFIKSKPQAERVSVGEALKEVIGEVGPQRVFAVVTDDAPDMAAAWAQVEEAFPHVSAVGCAAFGLRRLFDEVATQPSLKALHRRAEQVVRYVRERAALAETFRHWQATKMSGVAGGNARSTALFSDPTAAACQGSDWKGVVSGFTALLEGQATLQAMGLSQTLDVEASVRSSLQDPAFWKGVASSLNLLRLVGTYVDHVRREDAALSGVVELFSQLRYHLGTALPGSVLHSGEQKSVAAALDRCQEFCVRPIHAAAYMLDPKHVGQQTLSGEQVNSAYFLISNISHHLNLDQGKVLASFARFSAKEGLWKGGGIWSSCQHVSPATWWKGLCSSEPLSPVACAILQIPPTAAVACEALRSRLADARALGGGAGVQAERLEKLVAVQTNLRALEPSDQDFTCPESEEEDAKVSFESETQ